MLNNVEEIYKLKHSLSAVRTTGYVYTVYTNEKRHAGRYCPFRCTQLSLV